MTSQTETGRTVVHDTFVVERVLDATPARVFAAFSDPDQKKTWFAGAGSGTTDYDLDFRVGGREVNRGRFSDGSTYTFAAHYYDIVADQRIVYSYEMLTGEQRISVSLATVELKPAGSGTRLVITENGAYLDGLDRPEDRRTGTEDLVDAIMATLAPQPAQN